MIVLDTTVLVYAKGTEHPHRDPCRRLIAAIADAQIEATTTVEVIQEFVHVRARRRGRADAAGLGVDYASVLSPLLRIDGDDLRDGLRLFQSVDGLGALDAVLAAAATAGGATALVSADRAFAGLPGLPNVIPDAEGVRRLISPGGVG